MNQNTMSVSQKALIIFGIIIALVCTIGLMSYVNYSNYGNRTEQAFKGAWNNNKNILASCTNEVLEISQVPAMYRDDLTQIINADIQGRYGNDKSVLTKFVQERGLNFDNTLYQKIQQVMSSCNRRFENAQTAFLDLKRSYETELNNVGSGFWLGMAGYPKVNFDDYKIVVGQDTDKIFETGKRSPIKLR